MVDDSVVVRRLVSDVLAADPAIEVVGTAANGKVALAKIDQVNPDLVTLDIEMPVMDGLETLHHLRRDHPRLPVVMFSTLTERGASATLDALELGANDYVTKPANVGSVTASMEAVRDQLIPRIRGLCRAVAQPVAPVAPIAPRPVAPGLARRVDVVAIGASTGGPDALTTVLSALPGDLPVPVVIVQHMPPVFTRQFAERLDAKVALDVAEATSGAPVRPGAALIAPGDFHLRFRRTTSAERPIVAALDQGTPENYCRPAVDVMFRSVVEIWGGNVLGVVLTGMGSDGSRTCADIAREGGALLVQDEPTSVVWGMPGAVVAAGLAPGVLPIDRIGPAIVEHVRRSRPHFPSTLREASLS